MIRAWKFLDQQREYLLPVNRNYPHACNRCGGAVVDFATCYNCGRKYSTDMFPDTLGFGIYARSGEQSGSIMARYKVVTQGNLQATVTAILVLAIKQILEIDPAVEVVTVPSSRCRDGVHPLETLTNSALGHLGTRKQVRHILGPGVEPRQDRRVNPAYFPILERLNRTHVLLIDDTWTTGSNMLSATAGLRQAGAERVTAFSAARWLSGDGMYGEAELYAEAKNNPPSFEDWKFFQDHT